MGRKRNYRKGIVASLLEITAGGCAYCGVDLDESTAQIDHVNPDGGEHASNYLPACGPCNSTKGRKNLAEFRAYVENLAATRIVPEELKMSARQLGWLLDQEWFPMSRKHCLFPFEMERAE